MEVSLTPSKYHDMSVTHCPWGRPGGGAPNLDIRMRNILAEGLQPTPKCTIRSSALPPCRLNVGGGGGAEIRSAADRLYITLKDHPAMTFRNKGHVDIELRYKGTEPKVKLDKIVVKEKPSSKEKKKSRNKEPRMASKDHEPWGKPGPGGVPWRNPKAVGHSFMRSMGWTNKELLEELDQQTQTSPPKQNVHGQRESLPLKNGRSMKPKASSPPAQKCCALCSCKCTSTMVSSSSELQKVAPPPPLKKQPSNEGYKHSDVVMINKSTSTSSNNNNTFKVKKICPMRRDRRVPRLCNQQDSYGGDDRMGYKGSHGAARDSGGGVELVPLLARRRGMHRPTSLSSTDVTRPPEPNRWSKYDTEYLRYLKQQMIQRRRRERYRQEEEMDLCKKHFNSLDSFWGRPGHGAPRENLGNAKLNLDDLLYGVPVE